MRRLITLNLLKIFDQKESLFNLQFIFIFIFFVIDFTIDIMKTKTRFELVINNTNKCRSINGRGINKIYIL